MPEFISVLGLLVVMVAVFAGAYWASKWLAQKYQGGTGCAHTRYVKVLERTVIGRDSALLLVQVGEKIYLLSTTAKQIERIAELSKEDLPQIEQQEHSIVTQPSFLSVLQKMAQKGANHNGGEEG